LRLKRLPNVKDLPRVEIIWEDAAVDPEYDGKIESLPLAISVVNRTIGYLVKLTKKEAITVRDATDVENTVRWPYGIPRKLIQDIIYLTPIVKEPVHELTNV